MAEHNELGKWKKWLSNFYEKTATILQTNYTFQKAEIDILAQKKTHLLL
jgi:putative endonuclease